MKFSKIFWGLILILAAVLILLDSFGLVTPLITETIGEVSVFRVIVGIMLVSWGIERIARGKFNEIFIPLAILFMVFEKNVAFVLGLESEDIISNWILILCAVFLTWGFGMLMPKRRKKIGRCKRSKYIGSSSTYIDCSDFSGQTVENNMGACTVRFENTAEYDGSGVLTVENNMGSLVIHVPVEWCVRHDIENNMGSIRVDGEGDPNGPVLVINGENNMGSVVIKHV